MTAVQSRRLLIGRPASGSVVSRVRDPGNDVFAQKYACATCKITYEVPRGQKSKCPLCESRDEHRLVLEALRDHRDRLERATNELARLRPLVDLVAAMRGAVAETGPDDLVFLKTVAYRFRQDGSVTLKVLTGRGKGNKQIPIGFLVVPARRTARSLQCEPEVHTCTSIGGLALSRYVAEALRSVGPQTTMQHLVRAMNDHLPGGLQ